MHQPQFSFFQPAAVTGIPKIDYFGTRLLVIPEMCMHIYTIYCYLIYHPTGIARGGRERMSPRRRDRSRGPMEGSHDCSSWGELGMARHQHPGTKEVHRLLWLGCWAPEDPKKSIQSQFRAIPGTGGHMWLSPWRTKGITPDPSQVRGLFYP